MKIDADIFKANKKDLVGKIVEVGGEKVQIAGGRTQAIKFRNKAPEGFSTKKELGYFFVNFTNITPELNAQIVALLPKNIEKNTDDDEALYDALS